MAIQTPIEVRIGYVVEAPHELLAKEPYKLGVAIMPYIGRSVINFIVRQSRTYEGFTGYVHGGQGRILDDRGVLQSITVASLGIEVPGDDPSDGGQNTHSETLSQHRRIPRTA